MPMIRRWSDEGMAVMPRRGLVRQSRSAGGTGVQGHTMTGADGRSADLEIDERGEVGADHSVPAWRAQGCHW